MPLAAARTSSKLLQNFTPPALPRPPAWICALTIHCDPPRCLAASTAASGELATLPGGTAMPYCANSSLAWYSWKFIRYLERTGTVEAARVHCVGHDVGRRSDALPGMQCACHTNLAKTAQYGRLFSRKRAAMERPACLATLQAGFLALWD